MTTPTNPAIFNVGDVCRVWTNLESIGGPRRAHQNAVTVTRVTPTQIVARNEYGCTVRFYRSTCRKVGGDRLTPCWIEPTTIATVRTPNATTITTTPVEGSITTRRRQLDGVEFYFDARTTSTGKAGFVGWFPEIPGLAFESTAEVTLADHARDALRAMINSVYPTGVDAVGGPVVRVDRTPDGFALVTPSRHVIARGDKFALFAYAASRCLFAVRRTRQPCKGRRLKRKQQTQRGRPAELTVVALRVSCQDCNRSIASPSGNETWSAEEYARHAIATNGRGTCPHCRAVLAFGRVFLALIPEPASRPSKAKGRGAS